MTKKDLDYYINLVDKEAGFDRTDSNFESSTVGKMLSNSIAGCRETVHERKSQSMQQTSVFSYFKKRPQSPAFSNHHPHQSAAINTKVRASTPKKTVTQ